MRDSAYFPQNQNLYRFKKKKKIDSYETKRKKESKGLEVKLFESSTSFERRVSKRKFWGAGVAIIESVETLSRNSPLPGRGKSDESRILSGLYRDNSGIHIFLPAVPHPLPW